MRRLRGARGPSARCARPAQRPRAWPAWALDRWGAAILRTGLPLREADLGRAAEAAAAAWLRRAGWRPVGRRVPTPAAELDVVAWHGDVLVAVEVKAARVPRLAGLRFRPGQRLDAKRLRAQQRAIRGLARRWDPQPPARVDLLEVYVVGPWRRIHFVHLPARTRPLGGNAAQGPEPEPPIGTS